LLKILSFFVETNKLKDGMIYVKQIEEENQTMQNKTQELYAKAKTIFPGGTQLLSKRPELYAPGKWPAYFSKASGCEIWDIDGKHYFDLTTNGIGSCLLGYADPDVSAAVCERVNNGSMSSLNPPEEVALAERLIAIHPWAEQARFARSGGEIAAVAVRIARATTDRPVVAICGYHGWADWYLAVNLGESDALRGHLLPGLEPLGVPVNLRGSSMAFHFNDLEDFDRIVAEHGDRLAAVVMEPARHHDPAPGFLEHIRAETKRVGAMLIFDEITIGWRSCFGGVHLRFGVEPDIAFFAKALGNGHPISAVIGTKAAMEGAHGSFISSTYWTESVGPTAALAAIDKMERTRVWEHVAAVGETVREDWRTLGQKHGLPVSADDGYPCLAAFAFTENPAVLKTLYSVLMLEHGFLAGTSIYPTLAHTPDILDKHREAMDSVFARIAGHIKDGDAGDALGGPVCHSGFTRLN